jgi:hypothetical protein
MVRFISCLVASTVAFSISQAAPLHYRRDDGLHGVSSSYEEVKWVDDHSRYLAPDDDIREPELFRYFRRGQDSWSSGQGHQTDYGGYGRLASHDFHSGYGSSYPSSSSYGFNSGRPSYLPPTYQHSPSWSSDPQTGFGGYGSSSHDHDTNYGKLSPHPPVASTNSGSYRQKLTSMLSGWGKKNPPTNPASTTPAASTGSGYHQQATWGPDPQTGYGGGLSSHNHYTNYGTSPVVASSAASTNSGGYRQKLTNMISGWRGSGGNHYYAVRCPGQGTYAPC